MEHAVHSEQLEQVMRQLDQLDRQLLPKELDTETERRQRRQRIAQLAAEVATSAASIPDILEGVALTEEQRVEFIGLADALEARAFVVAETAESGDDASLRARVQEMHASCITCHDRFRVLPRVP